MQISLVYNGQMFPHSRTTRSMLIVCTYSALVHVISAYQDGSIDASDAASDQISSFRTRYGGDYRRAADRVGRMISTPTRSDCHVAYTWHHVAPRGVSYYHVAAVGALGTPKERGFAIMFLCACLPPSFPPRVVPSR